MKKIPTLFPKDLPKCSDELCSDPSDLGKVIQGPSLFPINELTFRIKVDGTACYLLNNQPYVRYDAKLIKRKRGKVVKVLIKEEVILTLPEGAIPCQEPDKLSGHWPHWIPLLDQSEYHGQRKGYETSKPTQDVSYECVGPSINGNPHTEDYHLWVHHAANSLLVKLELSDANCFNELKKLLKDFPWKGLVAYKEGVPVAKIRRCDFDYAPIQFSKVSEL